MSDECGNCGQQYTTDKCGKCDSYLVAFDGGVLCPDCRTVLVEGSVTGWQVLSQELMNS